MRYVPHTSADKERMLRALGFTRIEQLYDQVPQELRATARLSLSAGLTEVEVKRKMASLAAKNATPEEWRFFLGGGIYHHAIPSVVDAIISRSEFATAYTPYQPEASQGTLQALFEFQTLICQLTGMEVANAGLYDGASAAAEAILAARRIQEGRSRVLVSRALHPQYREVAQTYLRNLRDIELTELPFDVSGGTDLESARRLVDDQTICLVVGYPNFFGVVEELDLLKGFCEKSGALLIAVTTELLALALLKPPGAFGAHIAVGEGQSLGVPMSLGGPGFGFFACQQKFVRNLPGRLVGTTVDADGRRGYVLTLAAREQHIRREKATSNICTNQTLCALAATVFMAALGKTGLRRLAEINLRRAHETRDRLVAEAGCVPRFAGPFFNEFVLTVKNLKSHLDRCHARNLIPGLALEPWYPELNDDFLTCVTEMNTPEDIDLLVQELAARES